MIIVKNIRRCLRQGLREKKTHIEDDGCDGAVVGLSSAVELTHLGGKLGEEVLRVFPVCDAVGAGEVLGAHALEEVRDVVRGGREVLDTHDTLEDLLALRVAGGRGHDSGAVDEVDAAHEGDVLPDLGLSGDRGRLAHGLLLERVDDGRLADVRVPDEADRDLLLVREERRELAQELDEGSLSERVVDRRVEGDRRVRLGQDLDPSGLQSFRKLL